MIKLPNYPLEQISTYDPTKPKDYLYDGIIATAAVQRAERNERWDGPLNFISSYQGEVDYRFRGNERISFRFWKVPWRWSWLKPDERYWNFDTEEEFNQRGPNAVWGILHQGNEPVTVEVLELFRLKSVPEAVTGYYNHHINTWSICEPLPNGSSARPGHDSWYASGAAARFIKDNPQLRLSLPLAA